MPSVVDQIAQELGVSNASVSRALNDRRGVSDGLREKILARARELHYTSSVTARGLATSQTFSIGFFVREKPGLTTHSDPFYSEILHGVEQFAARTEYHISVATLADDVLYRPAEFRFVRERRIDAMILAGPDIPGEFVMAMHKSDLPLVVVDNQLRQTPVNCVNSDDEGGAYMAAQHLIARGHTRIGVLSGPQLWPSNARRVAGYRRALEAAELPLHVVHVERTTIDSGELAYTQITAQYPDLTALCAVNDSMAIGAIRAARARGCRVPADLSIIGFDDITWAALNDPPLTTIRIPKLQMGKEAALRLIALLNNPDLLPSEITLPVQLMERASTATPSTMTASVSLAQVQGGDAPNGNG